MRTETVEEYRHLIPGVRYVGGWWDGHSTNPVSTPRWLALHRVVVRHGGTVEGFRPAARKSQAREYSGDWVSERVDGDGRTFDFGLDHTECGNVKYLRAEGADELCPYICDLEYVVVKNMGIGVTRTKTVAWGCDRCDFRFSQHGETAAPWPPELNERTCGEPHT